MRTKDDAATELARHHFDVEPELRQVFRIVGNNEQAPGDPIKLLEVNAATPATGSVEIFTFAPTADVPFPVQIAEITPEELEQFRGDPSKLPSGWDLGTAQEVTPRTAAE